MRISLIAPILPSDILSDLGYLARQLQHSGAQLRTFLTADEQPTHHGLEELAPATIAPVLRYDQDDWLVHSDLYIYICAGSHPWLDSARERERGAVALYMPRTLATLTGGKATISSSSAQDSLTALAPYADLIFLSSSRIKEELIQSQLCQPERICLLPDISDTARTSDDEAAYRFTLSQALSQVAAWTPLRDWSVQDQTASVPPTARASADGADPTALPESLPSSFAVALAQLRSSATVTLPQYEIRSPTPVVGPLIAWIRRNLTSHLQKPYFDPILQSQERFNWQATQALEAIAQQLAEQHQRHAPATNESENRSQDGIDQEHQRRLAIATKRLLEIVQVLEAELQIGLSSQSANESQTDTGQAPHRSYSALQAELQELLVELQDLPST